MFDVWVSRDAIHPKALTPYGEQLTVTKMTGGLTWDGLKKESLMVVFTRGKSPLLTCETFKLTAAEAR